MTTSTVTYELDEEVMKKILDADLPEMEQAATNKDTLVAQRKIEMPDGWRRFSQAFGWKPKHIPDIPVPMNLGWPDSAKIFIPVSDMCQHESWPKQQVEELCFAMFCSDTTLLWGPSGTGKTELTKAVCAKLGIPWYRINCDKEHTKADLIGSHVLEYDDDGRQYIKIDSTPVTDAIRTGGMLVLDESFRSPSLMVLQSLLEKSSRTLIIPDAPGLAQADRLLSPPKNRFWLCLTDNTQGMGSSTGAYISEVQDLSTLNRINTTIYVDYPEEKVEQTMLMSTFPEIKQDSIKRLIQFGREVRAAFEEGTMLSTFSLRDSISVCEKLIFLQDVKRSLHMSWFNKLAEEDKTKATDIFHQVWGTTL